MSILLVINIVFDVILDMINRKEQSRRGEKLINNLLKKSVWVNKIKEKGLPYEIIWNNVLIDVKTTSNLIGNWFSFYDNSPDPESNVILVLVAFWNKRIKIWIDDGKSGKYTISKKITSDYIKQKNFEKEFSNFITSKVST
jgi:hypothetical protein